MGDGDVSERNTGEGFGGGITSARYSCAEVHFTAWAYTTPGLEDMQFINWVVINKGRQSGTPHLWVSLLTLTLVMQMMTILAAIQI